jgi:thiol:disulfide interchange protein DsbD
MRAVLSVLIALVGAQTATLVGQSGRPDPVSWTLRLEPATTAPGSPVLLHLEATIEEGWHLYSPTTPPGPIPTSLALVDSPVLAPGWRVLQPPPIRKFDPNFQADSLTFDGEVVFLFEANTAATAPPGPADLTAEVRYQVCNDQVCLRPVTKTAAAMLTVDPSAAAAVAAIPAGYTEVVPGAEAAPTAGEAAPGAGEAAVVAGPVQTVKGQGWAGYLLLAFGFGLAAVFTPCVFPMIPITMSFFLNSGGRALAQATAFCLGIVVLFTTLGVVTTALLGPFGVVQLGSNVWVNLFIAVVFIAFAFSLLGAYEISLPSGLLTRLNKASQGGGLVGTLLMGLTFALMSFSCVGPFMGTLLAASVQGDRLQPVVGMATFAGGLASPFFLLALFPSYLSRLPKSGGWLGRVKVVIGFMVLALALKYLSNVDAVMQWDLLSRDRYLAIWTVLFLLPGLYLLGLLQLPGAKAGEAVGVGRALAGAGFLAFALSLVPGMFGMQLGELEAYVPPAKHALVGGGGSELVWKKDDYEGALAEARAEGKIVFVNFTGYACTNCKWMKANMFTRPEIREAMSRFVLVELYTDGSDSASLANQQLQEGKFQTVAIPHYALVRPDEQVVANFVGLTRSSEEFLSFLNTGQPTAVTASSVP